MKGGKNYQLKKEGRIIMNRYGKKFEGDKPIRIRADSNDLVGIALSSIHIPFIYPQFIEPDKNGVQWWNRHKGSLEHFWHVNKELQVRTSIVLLNDRYYGKHNL